MNPSPATAHVHAFRAVLAPSPGDSKPRAPGWCVPRTCMHHTLTQMHSPPTAAAAAAKGEQTGTRGSAHVGGRHHFEAQCDVPCLCKGTRGSAHVGEGEHHYKAQCDVPCLCNKVACVHHADSRYRFYNSNASQIARFSDSAFSTANSNSSTTTGKRPAEKQP